MNFLFHSCNKFFRLEFFFLSRTFEIDAELSGHLDQDFDSGHELRQDVERAGADHSVDDAEAVVVVVGPDVQDDLVQTGSCRFRKLWRENKLQPMKNYFRG